MSSSVTATSARFVADSFWIDLFDGRTLGVRPAWYPPLLHATMAQRDAVTISGRGLHWAEIDEDISIDGLLAGGGDQTRGASRTQAAQ